MGPRGAHPYIKKRKGPRCGLAFIRTSHHKEKLVKSVVKALAVLALFLSGSASAQQAPVACTPYSIPVQATITDCGPGLTGTKFKTLNKVCPSGEVKESETFDTSACQPAAIGSDGALTAAARCRITPGACASLPDPANCPTGRKWSLAGSGIAHCVDVDPVCPTGTELKHDSLGNPSCETVTCPSNKVMKSNGTCGCRIHQEWNGSKCVTRVDEEPVCESEITHDGGTPCVCGTGTSYWRTERTCTGAYVRSWRDNSRCRGASTACPSQPDPAPTPDPDPKPVTCRPSSSTASAACTGGATGTRTRTVTTSCPNGSTGSPSTSYGSWNESQCSQPTTCTPSSSTESAACSGGRNGSMTRTVTTSCPSGSSGSPSTSYGAWNENQCSAACTPRSTTSSTSCGSGYSGTKYITTNYACPSGTSTTTDDSGCGCANGANDYPTCRKPLPPASNGCPDNYGGTVAVGTVFHVCDVPGTGSPNPKGMRYTCYAGSGWLMSNSGNTNFYENCE